MTREEHEKQYSDDEDEEDIYIETIDIEDDPKNETTQQRIARCLRALEALQNPIDFNLETNPEPEELLKMLVAMEELWTPIKIDSKKSERINEMTEIIEYCLGIGKNEEPTPYQVEMLMDKNLLEPIHNLNFRFAVADLIRNETYSRSAEFEGRFQRLFMLISYASELYYNFILWQHRSKNPELDLSDSSIGILRYLPRSEQEEYPDSTKFLLYCLLTLQVLIFLIIIFLIDEKI